MGFFTLSADCLTGLTVLLWVDLKTYCSFKKCLYYIFVTFQVCTYLHLPIVSMVIFIILVDIVDTDVDTSN